MNKENIIQEIDSLNRTLEFIQEEQSFIKSKLGSFLDKVVLTDSIVWAETLHQEILNRESAVQMLKNDISKLSLELKTKQFANNLIDAFVLAEFKKYKQQVGYIEIQFLAWKQSANDKFESAIC
jgi:archaellum biogenesis ATPase FlaH